MHSDFNLWAFIQVLIKSQTESSKRYVHINFKKVQKENFLIFKFKIFYVHCSQINAQCTKVHRYRSHCATGYKQYRPYSAILRIRCISSNIDICWIRRKRVMIFGSDIRTLWLQHLHESPYLLVVTSNDGY